MKKTNRKLLLLIFISALFFAWPKYIFAVDIGDIFGLSYRLIEGGTNRMELNRDTAYKSIEISITKSNLAFEQQYQLIQSMVERLSKRDNPGVVIDKIDNNFVMRRITEAQPAGGRFDIQSSDMRVSQVERIYTSDKTGTQLNFTLVYGIANFDAGLEPGDYTCQIALILMPTGTVTTTGQIVKHFFVDVTIPTEGQIAPSIEITPLSGLSTIYLNSQKEGKQTFDVEVKINKDFNTSSTIYQMLMQELQCPETGDQLKYEAVNYVVSGVTKGRTDANTVTAFSSGRMNIYTSKPNGQVDNNFIITYGLGDLSQAKAGRYRGRIQYYLEQEGKSKFLGALDLEVENERIFDIVITPAEEGATAIEFRDLKVGSSAKKSEVIIEVKSNIGKVYQVTQNMTTELMDKEGNVIPSKYFTLQMESLESKGKLKFPQKEEVRKGDTVIFVSDDKGSSDKFKVIYELLPFGDLRPGDYTTNISYSLVEL